MSLLLLSKDVQIISQIADYRSDHGNLVSLLFGVSFFFLRALVFRGVLQRASRRRERCRGMRSTGVALVAGGLTI